MWRSRRERSAVAPIEPQLTAEPELFDRDGDEDIFCGNLSTFATVKTRAKSGTSRRRSPQHGSSKDLLVYPYFGRFAGRWVTFEIDKGAGEILTSMKIRVGNTLISRRHCGPRQGSLRDVVLNYVHDVRPPADAEEEALVSSQPHSLKFLCEKRLLLCGTVRGIPLNVAKQFDVTTKQELHIRVWPSEIVRSQTSSSSSSSSSSMLKVRVPMRVSYAELQWFVSEKLGLPNPYGVKFRNPDGLRDIQSKRPLLSDQTSVDCFVLTEPSPRYTSTLQNLVLPVSLIGRGIEEVPVSPNMSLAEFETQVIRQFGLHSKCFLYVPMLLSTHVTEPTGLKMYANATRKAVLELLDKTERRFPIIYEIDPCMNVDHRELPLYQQTIYDAGLLENIGAPIVCFEVTGPTVPLSFRGMCSMSGESSASSTNDSSDRSSIFVQFSVENRIVSVNSSWNTSTLLKYIESITGFSCGKVVIGERTIPRDANISQYFCRDWIVRDPRGKYVLSPNVPQIIP